MLNDRVDLSEMLDVTDPLSFQQLYPTASHHKTHVGLEQGKISDRNDRRVMDDGWWYVAT
jgi:hypothetical protein